MTIAATSLASVLWDRCVWTDATHQSSRKDTRQMLLMCCCTDNVLSRWTPRYLTKVLKGTLFPPLFANSLSADLRQDAEPPQPYRCSAWAYCYSSRAEHYQYMSEHMINSSELIRWCTFRQLSVIGVLVIVTIMDRDHVWQRLRVQSKQDWSLQVTWNPGAHHTQEGKRWTQHHQEWLTENGHSGRRQTSQDKPVKDCIPITIGYQKPFQQYWMVQSVKSSTQIKQSHQGT